MEYNASLSADTSKEAAFKQFEILRSMGIEGRAAMTFQLSENLHQITKAGIRYRHPNYTEQQITQAYLKLILDKELFGKVFPDCEIEP